MHKLFSLSQGTLFTYPYVSHSMEHLLFEPFHFVASHTETDARLAGMSRWDYRGNPVTLARVFLYFFASMEGPQLILPVVRFVIFFLFSMVFHSVIEVAVLKYSLQSRHLLGA